MKKIIDNLLAVFAKAILAKYRPKVIGITGSVGKTSAKEAVFAVLKDNFNARQNIKNYNTEIGLPLTIIGAKSGGKNIFKWLAVFCQAIFLLIKTDKNYSKILILEMGADHPGDIEHLVKIAPCDIALVTAVDVTHLEFFGSTNGVKEEKEKIVTHQRAENLAILNFDDKLTLEMKKKIKARIVTIGLEEGADILATDLTLCFDEAKDRPYLMFKLHHAGSVVPIKIENALAKTHIYSFLFAFAVGVEQKMGTMEIIEKLKNFQPPKGRMNWIKGIKETRIIDDTYNSSPRAALAALNVLAELPAKRKIAVLGDMLELGAETENAHKTVGKKVAELKIDLLLAVGERASNHLKVAAIEAGMDENMVFGFDNSEEAGKFLQDKIKPGDLILVKGSQGIRAEKIVKEIMAEPQRAAELLVRQDDEWLKK